MPNSRAPLTAPIVSLLIASFIVQPTIGWTESPAAAADRAAAIREMRLTRGKEHLVAGQKALKDNDAENAFANYRQAVDDIADAPASKGARAEAVDGLTKSGNKLAEQRVTEGYYVSAVQVLQEVLRFNPNDKRTLKLAANIEAPDYFEKQITPKHRENVEAVKQLLIEAQGYRNIGKFDMAIRKAEEVVGRDPYNVAARKMIEDINGRDLHQPAMAGYNATRAQAMVELEQMWQRPYRRFNRVSRPIDTRGIGSRRDTASITKKLGSIILPKVEFRESTVREAIEYLVQKSKQLDPDGVGVNIVLKLDNEAAGAVSAPAPAPAPAGIPGLTPDAGAPAPAPALASGGSGTRITLTLNNVPLIEVVRYITNLANLKFKVDPFAVSILPLGASIDEMVIREWKVSSIIFRTDAGGGAPLDPAAAPGTPAPSALGGMTAARDFLAAKGVTFNTGAFAMYSRGSSTLVVKNTEDQLDLVERIIEIEGVDSAIKQIEIQAKFVEITQNNLKELSFDWLLGQANVPGLSTQALFFSGGTPGTGQAVNSADFPFTAGSQPLGGQPVTSGNRSGQLGINANAIDALLFGTPGASRVAPGIAALVGITDPSFQVVMRGLDQKKGVDLLSAPRVTTKSGNRAVIEIIREFRYPIEFEQPQIPQNFGGGNNGNGGGITGSAFSSNGTFPVTPTTPTTFETKNTGVTLEVEPTIGPDGASIDMNLAPQVVEFEGFINYGSPIQSSSINALGQQLVNVITPNVINQPIFSTRKVQTNVTVFDGATVVLGGLVREDVQKVSDKTPLLGDLPVFGRLFRSEIDQHIKRNLVIFVTARIINAEGQPITSDEEKEEVVDPLGLPEVTTRALPDVSGFSKDFSRMK
jgi:general secretion pathway protein D